MSIVFDVFNDDFLRKISFFLYSITRPSFDGYLAVIKINFKMITTN